MREITSAQNPLIKLVKSLDDRKRRREHGLFTAEGAKVVASARDQGWRPHALLIDADAIDRPILASLARWATAAEAEVVAVPSQLMARLVAKENPQAVLGVFHQQLSPVERVQPDAGALWVVLEQVRDPGNLGTIIRTVDAAGASGVILVGTTCDPFSVEAVRATMGSLFAVPLVRMEEDQLLATLARWPGLVVGSHLKASIDFRTPDYRQPTLLVMGSEGPGLSDTLAAACHQRVRIPMTGGADSLNLAIATALLVYEARRGLL
ncbi:MAG: RNA methyltransferase [Alphaproteobacteria bacterium]|nr:MAG: RNA methyltransferase [Alphaproteobacteria bacterium]